MPTHALTHECLLLRLSYIALHVAYTSQSHKMSPLMWDHTEFTCHPTQVNVPRLA